MVVHGGEQSQEIPNKVEIFKVEDLKNLPEGVCLLSADPDKTGIEVLGKFLYKAIKSTRYDSYLDELADRKVNSPEYLIGTVISGSNGNRNYRELINQIDNQFPNLCWFRGGDYVENRQGAPGLTEFASFGANGYLGDYRAVGYAKNNYNNIAHKNPVLYIVSLKDLMIGLDEGAVILGSEHDYDVVIAPRGDSYNNWALKSVKVCDLGNSAEDFDTATKILREKAFVVRD